MRFLFLINMTHSARPAGIQQSVRVCHQLAKSGAVVHAFVCSKPFRNESELLEFFGLRAVKDLHWHFFPYPFRIVPVRLIHRIWGYAFFAVRVLKLILTRERYDYDVYFARGNYFPAVFIFLKKLFAFKIIYELHEIVYLNHVDEKDLLSTRKLIDTEGFAYRRADGVIAISNTLKDLAEKKWGRVSRITVIPSGTILFKSRPLQSDRFLNRLFFVGNFYWFSGLEYAIKALSFLPDTFLTVIGGGAKGSADHERIHRLVTEFSLEDRVDFRGFVEPRRLPAMYAEAGVLVMPLGNHIRSKYFVSPLKLFEYMSARRPIIASDLPTIREILRHEYNALLVRPEDPKEIFRAVVRLQTDPGLALRLGEQAYGDVQEYSMEKKCAAIRAFIGESLSWGEC